MTMKSIYKATYMEMKTYKNNNFKKCNNMNLCNIQNNYLKYIYIYHNFKENIQKRALKKKNILIIN